MAIAHLTKRGVDPDDAADYVAEATADVLRQLEGRAEDRQRDPVAEAKAEAKAELAEAGRPSIFAALHDERLVDDAGFMALPDDAPGLYRKYRGRCCTVRRAAAAGLPLG